MIELDGNVMLPEGKGKGFKKPDDISARRWQEMKPEMWKRAYTHCLYTLPLLFDLPLHSVVPRMAKKMMEASDPFNVALRFMGEMELAGYIKFERGMDNRTVVPTKKILSLDLDCERAPESSISYPLETGEKIPREPIRGGIANAMNRHVLQVTADMASEEFEINTFMLDIVTRFEPEFDKVSSRYMYDRSLQSAHKMLGKKFKFPYFADSRGRMYTDTTCGFNPQGADYEKSLVIPTYKEVLTSEGYRALLETAAGYSEMDWSPMRMIKHATYPDNYKDEWLQADKPYCYLATANLIKKYLNDPSTPLPAFIPLDGRCSGLQHWSAVIRSNAITRHLGMHIEEDPLDIYEKVAFDWSNTLDDDLKYLATRKAAKIPVMTWGYNATMMTSMDHMAKLFGAKSVWDDDEGCYKSAGDGLERAETSKYGVELYRQLQTTLGPLQAAVDWVSNSAHFISRQGNINIRWPTPDGFTCMQRKVKGERLQLKCKLSNEEDILLEILDFTKEVPNAAKHKSAIAPNVIHSLDATHLRMVARRLKELGLPMIFIHDSFATHCNHRKVLYKIIIETFIELYSREYLKELKEYWESLYNIVLDNPPPLGEWKPSDIKGLERFYV